MSPYERKLNQVHDIFESEIEASDLTEDERERLESAVSEFVESRFPRNLLAVKTHPIALNN